jgi:hypothetical protein
MLPETLVHFPVSQFECMQEEAKCIEQNCDHQSLLNLACLPKASVLRYLGVTSEEHEMFISHFMQVGSKKGL